MTSLGLTLREKGGKLRGFVDLLSGCYPKFVFGGSTEKILPMFHFHEVTEKSLEAQFLFLAENGYRTVDSEALARFVRDGINPGSKSVVLCFDDAWTSLWTVAGPLLRKYGLRAIVYAIPGRMTEGHEVRPTIESGLRPGQEGDDSDMPLATWKEIRTLHQEGLIDVQSHTYSHSMVFCSEQISGFVGPNYENQDLFSFPLISSSPEPSYLQPENLGAPLFFQRSRMSDGRRFVPSQEQAVRCQDYVKAHGGKKFFERPRWNAELRVVYGKTRGEWESCETQEKVLTEELERSKQILQEKLPSNVVKHLCFPWGVSGELSRNMALKVGYTTAVSDRLFGLRAVRVGDPPFNLMRLSNRYIFNLPGHNRRFFIFS